MAKSNFYLKDSKSKGESLIYLFFSYNGTRLKYSTGESITPKDWNSEAQRAKKSMTGALELNNLLDRIEEEVRRIYRNGVTNNHVLTNEYIKERLDRQINPGSNAPKDFFGFFDEIKELQKTTKSNHTLQKYQTTINHLKSFQKKRKYTVVFEKIDSKFMEYFQSYCLQDLKIVDNSFSKYIKALKTFLNWATERGYNTNLAFLKFKVKERDADIIYLTEKELLHLLDFDLKEVPYLERVRDAFCFGCFTGLRFSDIARVSKSTIKKDEIHLVSEKTTESIRIPLNDYALEILEKYDYSFPVISNQKSNDYLKKLGEYCSIDDSVTLTKFRGAEELSSTKPKYKFLSTHVARRTFVTLSLEKRMRPEIVMSITGHKDYKTFKKYIKITDKVKGAEMKSIWHKPKQNDLKEAV
jgi:integrase